MCLFMPRLRIRNHVTLSNNNITSSRTYYPPILIAQTTPLPGAVSSQGAPYLISQIRPDHTPVLPPLDLGPIALEPGLELANGYQGETASFVVKFTYTGAKLHMFHSRHKDLIRVLSVTEQLLPSVNKVTLRKDSGEYYSDKASPLMDFEKNQEAVADYVTLDLCNGEISTNLDERKLADLKERVGACKDRATKLKEIQLSLDMTGEKGDVLSIEGHVEMGDWKRMMEPDEDSEKKDMFKETKRRLEEAKKNFSASIDKLSEELVTLKNVE